MTPLQPHNTEAEIRDHGARRPPRSSSRRKARSPPRCPVPAPRPSTPSPRCPRAPSFPASANPTCARPEDVASALRSALDEVSPRTRFVTLVVPDPAVRVFVLDFDTLPAKPAEALPVLRFRLRKTVPFDVEQAPASPTRSSPRTRRRGLVGRSSCPSPSSRNTRPPSALPVTSPAPCSPPASPPRAPSTPWRPCSSPTSAERRSPPPSSTGRTSCCIAPSTCPPISAARVDEVKRSIAVAAARF